MTPRKEGLQPSQAQPSISESSLSARNVVQASREYPEHGSKANWAGSATVVLISTCGPDKDYPALTTPLADVVCSRLTTDGQIRTARSLAEEHAARLKHGAAIGDALALFDKAQHVGIVVHDSAHGRLLVPVLGGSFLAFDSARTGGTP